MDRNPSTPASGDDRTDAPLSPELPTGRHRAEDVLPSELARRGHQVIDLDASTSTDDEPMIVTQGDLRVTAEALGSMRVLAALLEDGPHAPIAKQLGEMAAFWQRHVKTIAGIAAVMVLSVVGVIMPTGAPAAQAATVASVPAMESPEPDTGIVQHPTKFGRGLWFDQGNGDEYVAAPLLELTDRYGWLPSPWERVVVQEQTRRGIRTRGALTRTNAEGIARGILHLGGGIHRVRVVHPADLWTLGTTGTWRTIVVTTEPLDIN